MEFTALSKSIAMYNELELVDNHSVELWSSLNMVYCDKLCIFEHPDWKFKDTWYVHIWILLLYKMQMGNVQ